MNQKKTILAVILIAILSISVLGAAVAENPFEALGNLNTQTSTLKTNLEDCKDTIVNAEAEIADCKEKLPSLKKKAEDAEKALEDAKENLEAVCSNSYYSFYFCNDSCKPLHDVVSTKNSVVSSASKAVYNCEDSIDDANEAIENATSRIAEIENQLSNLSSQKVRAFFGGFFSIIAMLIAIAGLAFLAKYLLAMEEKKFGIIACALMAAASLIYILLPTAFPTVPYFCSIIIFGIFYKLIAETSEQRVLLRVTSIILSVIILLFAIPSGSFVAILYVVTLILVSLILVPGVFYEYIDIAKFIFFSLITLGIYQLIWLYNVTKNLNKVENTEERKPVRELLLCIFLPFYYIFWMYKTAEITELYGVNKGKQFKIDILCLVFTFVSPLISTVIIQDKINSIVGKPE